MSGFGLGFTRWAVSRRPVLNVSAVVLASAIARSGAGDLALRRLPRPARSRMAMMRKSATVTMSIESHSGSARWMATTIVASKKPSA